MNPKFSACFSALMLVVLLLAACSGTSSAPATAAPTTPPIVVGFTPASVCLVPNVVGLDQTVAEGMLTDLGLQPVKSVQVDPSVAKDAVISQKPVAGKRLEPCTGDVIIVVSRGGPTKPADTPAPPTLTPTITPIPSTATATPTQAPFAFSDNFNTGIDPGWRIVDGQPFIKDGWLKGTVTLETGKSSRNNYTVQLDFDITPCCSALVYIIIGEKYRFVLDKNWNRWDAFTNGDWKETMLISNGGGNKGHLKLVTNGNEYTAFINDNEIGKTVYGEPINGTIRIYFSDLVLIDNVVVTAP